MKILVFLHGTLIMHKNAFGKTREERVRQSMSGEESVLVFESYVPVGNAVEKLKKWQEQGAEILYMSSHELADNIEKDKIVLTRYNFPKGKFFWRKNGKPYAEIAEEIMPDILIEDDCESIGGEKEMIYPHLKPELKKKIKSTVVKEFEGVGHLSDKINNL